MLRSIADDTEKGVIRHLLFSWEAWVIYYGTVGIGWGIAKTIRHGRDEEIRSIEAHTQTMTEQSEPKEPPTFEANYDPDEDAYLISHDTKPGWMK